MTAVMTKGERDDLGRLIRRREKLAKSEARGRTGRLKAETEKQLGSIYTPDDDAVMSQLYTEAAASVKEAAARLKERCAELGIPPKFAPSIGLNWYGRGETCIKQRRDELRKMAYTELEARERDAVTQIERWSLESQEALILPTLTSEAAQRFFEALPNLDLVLPALGDAEMKLLVGQVSREAEQ